MKNEEYMISQKQIKMLQTLYRRIGMDEETRREMLYNLTNHRTNSTKDLTAHEAKTLITKLMQEVPTDKPTTPPIDNKAGDYTPSRLTAAIVAGAIAEVEYESRKLCGAIYRLSLDIPFLNKGYDSTNIDEIRMNYAKIGKWCREKTIYKKNLTQMDIKELKGVKKQLEAIAAKERKKQVATEC